MKEFVLPINGNGSTKNTEEPVMKIFSVELIRSAGIPWFCHLRWVVVTLFFLLWVIGKSTFLSQLFGIQVGPWSVICSVILFICNILFYLHFKLRCVSPFHAKLNITTQIICDLLILTVAVHYIGSTNTFVSFAYLFHIILACIFFSRFAGFAVLCFSAFLFVICVLAEQFEIIGKSQFFVDSVSQPRKIVLIDALSAILHWFVVWYLVDHLSSVVKRLDAALSKANNELSASQQEKLQHMLTMAHQLKTPVSAIFSRAQLLLGGYCGKLTDEAREELKKITIRCQSMLEEIKDMLQLASISHKENTAISQDILLDEVIKKCFSQLTSICDERKIQIISGLSEGIIIKMPEEHLVLLISNLLSNAVTYSRNNSKVIVKSFISPEKKAILSIQDFGIGIPEDKIPRIFEQYYRTSEAKEHNSNSSGLGLAIVKEIAIKYNLQIRVKSFPGEGTTFTVSFPDFKLKKESL